MDRLLDRLEVTLLPSKACDHAPVTLLEVLVQCWRYRSFDSEAGSGATDHPWLLYALACIVDLNNFEFAQAVAGDAELHVDVVVRALYVKAGDQVFEAPAHAPSDF
jgi:hypothetical protein